MSFMCFSFNICLINCKWKAQPVYLGLLQKYQSEKQKKKKENLTKMDI